MYVCVLVCVRVCARVVRCTRARAYSRVSRAQLSITLRRCGPRVVLLADVRVSVGIRHEHRRVEHRASDDDVLGMFVRMYVRTALCTCSYRYM